MTDRCTSSGESKDYTRYMRIGSTHGSSSIGKALRSALGETPPRNDTQRELERLLEKLA